MKIRKSHTTKYVAVLLKRKNKSVRPASKTGKPTYLDFFICVSTYAIALLVPSEDDAHNATQAPTLIDCLVVKERCRRVRCASGRSAAVSAAEKRDYEGVFSACQLGVSRFTAADPTKPTAYPTRAGLWPKRFGMTPQPHFSSNTPASLQSQPAIKKPARPIRGLPLRLSLRERRKRNYSTANSERANRATTNP